MASEHGASFEPDEHLATLVLRHVGKVRDRLALECVSRVWRAAGQIPGVWQWDDLTLTGDLAARLTDARVCRMRRRAGPNLRSLVINDAPAAFTGEGLRSHAALVDVTWSKIIDLLRQLRIHEAPKVDRMRRLALAGCAVDKAGGVSRTTSTPLEATHIYILHLSPGCSHTSTDVQTRSVDQVNVGRVLDVHNAPTTRTSWRSWIRSYATTATRDIQDTDSSRGILTCGAVRSLIAPVR
jgi:hypothetical protein